MMRSEKCENFSQNMHFLAEIFRFSIENWNKKVELGILQSGDSPERARAGQEG